MKTNKSWTRSNNGMLAGVCESIALELGIAPGLVRIIWLGLSIFLGGGILLYLIIVLSIPRDDQKEEARKPQLLGVCSRIAHNYNLDIGLTRLLALCLIPASFGGTLLFYFLLNFVIEKREERPLN